MILREAIIIALKNLGGEASLSEIEEEVLFLGYKTTAKSFNSSIRSEIERFSSDTSSYLGKEDLFYSVEGIGQGVWGLRNP